MSIPTTNAPSVLIVDPSPENRDVLANLLARGGVQAAFESTGRAVEQLTKGNFLALVVDLDGLVPHEATVLIDRARRAEVAIVAVGTNRPSAGCGEPTFVRKPYHYRELVRRILATLGSSTTGQAGLITSDLKDLTPN